MKRALYIGILSVVTMTVSLMSCDKIDKPIKPAILLDTTIFEGNWEDYPDPVWTQNTNSNRNFVLEDYTGHRCPNCPDAATEAEAIESANPDRVFVASVHAGPGGLTAFQELADSCGIGDYHKFCTEFFNSTSIAYGQEFSSGFGFFANPQGTVSRITPSGESMFSLYNAWSARVSNAIAENNLQVNIQAQSNYYSSTNGFYLHTEIEPLADLPNDCNTVVYLLENEVIDYQDDNGYKDSAYHHHNILRGTIDDLPWGQTVPTITAGSKSYFDYSYKLPTGKDNSDYHLLIYVYDITTYEILQVIKHEL
ncbi:Omp28-related outer membrane protein [Paracrocinitomix mangrovi]|uniref:Omp28-related outer membrane protein n=1 Tax=Paracrocinitomix mangrovi TaxID=2862509 RepID=UPI001C8EDCC9|nr:Omp28-related outer membrane protein [Paracrocinitomix mangrovi]UKN00880.1 Omp28-related outer membrane protein [Paracrocinitomix mangrovi]